MVIKSQVTSGRSQAGSEQELLDVVRQLPSERVAEVIDFASFLQTRSLPARLVDEDDGWLNDTEAQMQAEDALWEATYTRHRDQLATLVEAARAEIDAGSTQPMFDANGKFAVE
jgi:hypothetical protein